MSTKLIASLCPYCAVGCGMYLEVEKGKATGIEYMTDHPACEGALCPKGNARSGGLESRGEAQVSPEEGG